MISHKFYFYLIPLFSFGVAAAQDLPSDLELWQGTEVEYDLNDNWSIELEEQFRLHENINAMKVLFLQTGLQYKAADFLDFKLQYRYSNKPTVRNSRRLAFDTKLKYDIPNNPIDIIYRFRMQNTKESYTERHVNYLRNKLELDANLSKLVDPFLAYENFFRVRRYEESESRTNRFTLGLRWRVENDLELQTYFRRDYEHNVSTPNLQNIIGVMIKYDLN